MAARLPTSAQDKEHQKKIQTRLNSKIPEVCLRTKGIAFWDGKWGPKGPVLCNDLWLLEVGSALYPAQPSSWESLGTFSVSSCRGLPRPDGNPEHCAEFCRQTLQASQWTKSVVRRHLTMSMLVTVCLYPGMKSPRLCQAASPINNYEATLWLRCSYLLHENNILWETHLCL